ncbi:unnamed protein product [Phytomonas sp. EM1]|nr:unnamed protein product [Phytomonas sp. EM1]|eukprot:CCW62110.1 unnamed protein product [Phytomonas sp. isolate EM1]
MGRVFRIFRRGRGRPLCFFQSIVYIYIYIYIYIIY